MSHIVTVQTRVQDANALAAATRRLNIATPVHGTAKLFSGEATGMIVQLSGWTYPAVIDLASGSIQCDTYEGQWGNPQELDRLLQAYAVERAKVEARKKGYSVHEETLQDGSIKVQIVEAV